MTGHFSFKQLLKENFNQFMPNKNIKFYTSQIEFITPKGILIID
jgi:hypothetical protein